MFVTNITDDIENMTLCNCTDNENNNIEIIIPLITIVPCGMSLICLTSLMVYTLVKHLINKKQYLSNINGDIFIPKTSS